MGDRRNLFWKEPKPNGSNGNCINFKIKYESFSKTYVKPLFCKIGRDSPTFIFVTEAYNLNK